MIDSKSSLSRIVPLLTKNFACYVVSHKPKAPFLRRILAEFKTVASKIEPIGLSELPGLSGVSVSTNLVGGAVVALIAKAMGAKQVFEFGTYLGETAMLIAENCPACCVVTLDLPDGTTFDQISTQSSVQITDSYLFKGKRGSAIRGEPAQRIKQIRQDSATIDTRPFVERFCLVYIDGSHSYSAVKADTAKAFVMLKPGGCIIWDDYLYPGVWRFLNELVATKPDLPLYYLYGWGKVILLPERLR